MENKDIQQKVAQFDTKIFYSIDKAVDERIKGVNELNKSREDLKIKESQVVLIKEDLVKQFKGKTSDLAITDLEKEEIFKNLPKAILRDLGIVSSHDLMKFLGISTIPEQKKFENFMNLSKSDPIMFFNNMFEFKDEPWAEGLIMKCCLGNERNIRDFMVDCAQIIDKPWAFSLILTFTLLDSGAEEVVQNFKEYQNAKWADKILLSAWLVNGATAEMTLMKFENYKNRPIAQKLVSMIVGVHPDLAFVYHLKFKNFPWWKNLFLSACERAPQDLVQSLGFLDFGKNLDPEFVEMLVPYIIKASDKLKFSFFLRYNSNNRFFIESFFERNKNKEKILKLFDEKNKQAVEIEEILNGKNFQKLTIENNKKELLWDEKLNLEKELKALKKAQKDNKNTIDNKKTTLLITKINKIDSDLDEFRARGISERQVIERRIKLHEDPGLEKILYIHEDWIVPKPETKRALIKFMAMISRNLYFQNKEVNKENVTEEYKQILQQREKDTQIALFEDRNVVLAAHNEKINGKDRFGKPLLVIALRMQGANLSSDNVIKPKDDLESLKKAKNLILWKIINTPPPFTIIFDGHGAPDAVFLSNGQIKAGNPVETENTIKLTSLEISEALKKRYLKLMNNPANLRIELEKPPIFIFASCNSSTLLRNIYKRIKTIRTKIISLGMAEYNQYGFSELSSKYGSWFFEKVLNLGEFGKTTTLGTVMENEHKDVSTPSLYIRSESGGIKQVAERKQRKAHKDSGNKVV